MRGKKAKELRRAAYALWVNSDRTIFQRVIYKALKKEYKYHKGK